jgi:hypothetical protein
VILGKLAIDKNHFKGLIEIPRVGALNFNKRVRETKEALTMLKY